MELLRFFPPLWLLGGTIRRWQCQIGRCFIHHCWQLDHAWSSWIFMLYIIQCWSILYFCCIFPSDIMFSWAISEAIMILFLFLDNFTQSHYIYEHWRHLWTVLFNTHHTMPQLSNFSKGALISIFQLWAHFAELHLIWQKKGFLHDQREFCQKMWSGNIVAVPYWLWHYDGLMLRTTLKAELHTSNWQQ